MELGGTGSSIKISANFSKKKTTRKKLPDAVNLIKIAQKFSFFFLGRWGVFFLQLMLKFNPSQPETSMCPETKATVGFCLYFKSIIGIWGTKWCHSMQWAVAHLVSRRSMHGDALFGRSIGPAACPLAGALPAQGGQRLQRRRKKWQHWNDAIISLWNVWLPSWLLCGVVTNTILYSGGTYHTK